MYESDWFLEDTMNWEEIPDNNKTLNRCQQFFEAAYIARKCYIDTKGQKQEQANKIAEVDLQMYLTAIEAKAHQDALECD